MEPLPKLTFSTELYLATPWEATNFRGILANEHIVDTI